MKRILALVVAQLTAFSPAKATAIEVGRGYAADDSGLAGCPLVARRECGYDGSQKHGWKIADTGPQTVVHSHLRQNAARKIPSLEKIRLEFSKAWKNHGAGFQCLELNGRRT